MRRISSRIICSLAAILGILGAVAFMQPELAAQEMPEEFTNLKLLDKDISKDDLKEIMKGFTEQLGVKCSHCHVLDEYYKDDNEHKIVARQMIRLVQYMRDNASEYFKEGTELNQIGCWTCHRGEAEIDGFFPEEEDEDWP